MMSNLRCVHYGNLYRVMDLHVPYRLAKLEVCRVRACIIATHWRVTPPGGTLLPCVTRGLILGRTGSGRPRLYPPTVFPTNLLYPSLFDSLASSLPYCHF